MEIITLYQFITDQKTSRCLFCKNRNKFFIETINTDKMSNVVEFNTVYKNGTLFCRSRGNNSFQIKIANNFCENTLAPPNTLLTIFAQCANIDCQISSIKASFINDNSLTSISEMLSFENIDDNFLLTVISDDKSTEVLFNNYDGKIVEGFKVQRIPASYWENSSTIQLKKKLENIKLLG